MGREQSVDLVDVPPYAGWFSVEEVHEIEKRAFPDFFSSNHEKSPAYYVETRNYIVQTYRNEPTRYLSLTAIRRHVTGDVATILRIHTFLEQWGLINTGPTKTVRMAEETVQVAALGSADRAVGEIELNTWPSVLREEKKRAGLGVRCSTCGRQVGETYFYCLKAPKTNICQDCFGDGRFPSVFFSGDFVRIEDAETEKEEWNEQEILHLLEGIEMFWEEEKPRDAWEKISGHVESRTAMECIQKFLELPIESKFLDMDGRPFVEAGNPVLSLVSFLASHIHPAIGAKAASAALQMLGNDGMGDSETLDELYKSLSQFAEPQKVEEEKNLSTLLKSLVEIQIRKSELKLEQLDNLQRTFHAEVSALERQNQSVFEERIRSESDPQLASI